MTAGITTLATIDGDDGFYDRLEALGQLLEDGVNEVLARTSLPCHLARVGSMWTLFFAPAPVTDWHQVARSDVAMFGRFFHALLARGVLVAPSQFEANFISAAHTADDIAFTVEAIDGALRSL
jgi:glutamate-1-semialdehyde 2,1-aminomutase